MNIRIASVVRGVLTAAVMAVLLGSGQAFALAPAVATGPSAMAQPGTTAGDIRDIRGPEAVPDAWLWTAWLAAGALLAAGGYAGWRWNQRRKTAPLLPFELALARLEAARALMQPDTVREFSIEASAIVRQYLEDRFEVRAAHRTTPEFLGDLVDPRNALLEKHRVLLAAFLQHCDLAKFAGWSLSSQDMKAMHHSARMFVLATGKPDVTEVTRASTPASADEEFHVPLPTT